MRHTVRLILPDLLEGVTTDILQRITRKYGGMTMFSGRGLWVASDGLIAGDSSDIVECHVKTWTDNDREWWYGLAAEAARLLDQECIYLSVRPETVAFIGQDGDPLGDGLEL